MEGGEVWDIKPGDEVVCVDGDAAPGADPSMWDGRIRAGAHYVIRWIGEHEKSDGCRYVGVRLDGVERGDRFDTPFLASRFRPVRKRSTETGMSILRGILDRENDGVRAPEKEKA